MKENVAYKLPPVGFPRCNLLLRHCDVDGIDHNAVTLCLGRYFGISNFGCIIGVAEPLVIICIVSLMKPGGKAEITELDVSLFVTVCGLDEQLLTDV